MLFPDSYYVLFLFLFSYPLIVPNVCDCFSWWVLAGVFASALETLAAALCDELTAVPGSNMHTSLWTDLAAALRFCSAPLPNMDWSR